MDMMSEQKNADEKPKGATAIILAIITVLGAQCGFMFFLSLQDKK